MLTCWLHEENVDLNWLLFCFKCISYENFPRKYVALCCWLVLSKTLCICNGNYSKTSSTLPFASGFIINANLSSNQPILRIYTNKIVPSVILCTHLHVYNVLNIFHILVQNFFFHGVMWIRLTNLCVTIVYPWYLQQHSLGRKIFIHIE